MKKRMLCLGIISLFLFTSVLPIYAFGKINTLSDDSLDEYTLYAPWYSKTIFLIDKNGEIAHEWKSDYANYVSVYLTDNKNLLHCTSPGINPRFNSFGGSSGRIEILDWDGKIIWEFEYSNELHRLHHDVEVLPNGNILMVAWEYKSYEEAINAGRKPNLLLKNPKTNEKELWPTKVIEVDNNKNIVWEWSLWDHLIQDYDQNKDNYGIVSDHPELVDINFAPDISPDWIHVNSIDYNPQLDQIMLSCCHLSEIWIIDHSTTTEEAKGHTGGKYGRGGDLLYRWGNPFAYGFGDINDQNFSGNMMHNGLSRDVQEREIF